MSGFYQKRAEEALECRINWQEGYLEAAETVIEDLGWSVSARKAQGHLEITGCRADATRSRATIDSGEPGAIYMLAASVRTSANRVLERAVTVRVT